MRHAKEVFEALSISALVIARNGKGLLPAGELKLLTEKYEQYRDNYNSCLVCCLTQSLLSL